MQEEFWDQAWTGKKPYKVKLKDFSGMEAMLLNRVGPLDGKRVLDLGCGAGRLSVAAAKMGAQVTAVDTSQAAAEATEALASHNGVASSVRALSLDAMKLRDLDVSFDLVFGKFILHHVEPFRDFAEVLFDVLKENGRGVFFENNARNPLLMFARKYLAGRFGIPKYGDQEEYPLEPREIKMLGQRFGQVRVHYPEFIFFRKLNTYLFRHKERFSFITSVFDSLDEWIYRHLPSLHKYSYHQIVECRRVR